MPQASRFDLVDQLLGGKLAETLTQLRTDEVSYDEMVRHFEGLNVKVSRETLRRWVKELDEKAPAA